MRRLAFISLALLAFVPAAMANLTPGGDPFEGNSWYQQFNESGVGNFNHMQFVMIDDGTGDLFKVPALSGWSETGWSQTGNGQIVVADKTSPSTNVNFTLGFEGSQSSPLSFYFQAWYGNELKESVLARWSGSSWNFSAAANGPSRIEGASVPAPGAALVGVVGIGLIGWFRRRLA